MGKYLVAVVLWIKKSWQVRQIEIEYVANSAVFQKELDAPLEDMLKELVELKEKNQADLSKDELARMLQLEEEVKRTRQIQDLRNKAEREIASAKNVIAEIKKIVFFKK